jgi:hypothetical protein
MFEPSPDDVARFADSLTVSEMRALEAWLGMGSTIFREYHLHGALPSTLTPEAMVAIQDDFRSALAKAPLCRQVVFRGLSAGRWRPDAMEHLFSIVRGPDAFSLATYCSATASETIGRSFCRTEPEDEERNLAVLIRVQPVTARWLRPFVHSAVDEEEVVLLRGTQYRRVAVRRLPEPKESLEYWEVDLEEVW